jgi:hypothetical protein
VATARKKRQSRAEETYAGCRCGRLCGFALEGGLPAGGGGLAMEACGAVGFGCFGLRAGRGVGELFTEGLELLFFRAEAGFARGEGLRWGVGHEGILLWMGLRGGLSGWTWSAAGEYPPLPLFLRKVFHQKDLRVDFYWQGLDSKGWGARQRMPARMRLPDGGVYRRHEDPRVSCGVGLGKPLMTSV